MKKRILSLLLVFCMLLPIIPATVWTVAAAEEKTVYKYSASAAITATISEDSLNKAGKYDLTTEEGRTNYKNWLLEDGTFALTQQDAAWKIGAFNKASGTLDPFSRVAFFAGDHAYGHDTNWLVTDATYKSMVGQYITSLAANNYQSGSANIWNGCALGMRNTKGGITTSSSSLYAAIQYTVEQAGTYTFSAEALSDGGAHALAIFVNNQIVWPQEANADDLSTWFATDNTTKLDSLNTALAEEEGISLLAGQTVSFVVSRTTDSNPVTLWPVLTRESAYGNGRYVLPPVTYSYADAAKTITVTSSETKVNGAGTYNLSTDDGLAAYKAWLAAADTFAVKQSSSLWKVGSLATNGTLTPFTRVAFFAGDSTDGTHNRQWHVTEADYQSGLENYITKLKANGGTYGSAGIWNGMALAREGFCSITTSGTAYYTAMQFTAPEDGNYAFSLNALKDSGAHYLAVMKNDTVVWPAGATAADRTGWYAISSATTAAEINAKLGSMGLTELQKGDTVSFVLGYYAGGAAANPCDIYPCVTHVTDGYTYIQMVDEKRGTSEIKSPKIGSALTLQKNAVDGLLGWDANGDGNADYFAETTITVPATSGVWYAVYMPSSTFAYPTWDAENSKVVFSDDWEMGAYSISQNAFLPLYAINSAKYLICTSSGPWGANGGGGYPVGGTYAALSGSLSNQNYRHSIRYMAPCSGTVTVNWETLVGRRYANETDADSNIAFSFAIYQNGTKVWPLDKEWATYASEETYSGAWREDTLNIAALMATDTTLPLSLTVKEGDYIEFRTQMENSSTYWINSHPKVAYTAVTTDYYDAIVSTSFAQGSGNKTNALDCRGLEVDTTTGKAVLPAGWQLVGYKTTGYGDGALVLDSLVTSINGTAYAQAEGKNAYGSYGDSWIVASSRVGFEAGGRGGYPAVNWLNSLDGRWDYWGGRGGIVSNATYAAGYQYTVTKDCCIDITLDKLETRGSQDRYAALFVGGVMVWPTAGGSYTNTSDWCNLQTYKTAGNENREDITAKLPGLDALYSIPVKAGDKVELLFRNTSEGHTVRAALTVTEYALRDTLPYLILQDGLSRLVPLMPGASYTLPLHTAMDGFAGWDTDGDGKPDLANGATVTVTDKPVVLCAIYNDGTTADSFKDNLPYAYTDGKISGYDDSHTNWQIVKGDLSHDFTVNTTDKLTLSNLRKMNTLNTSGIFMISSDGVWNTKGGGMYTNCKFAVRSAASQTAVGANYVAPYSGEVTLDYDSVVGMWEINQNDGQAYITVGGEKYYPYYTATTDGETDYYYFKSDKARGSSGAVRVITLAEGDTYYRYDGSAITEATATAADAGQKKEVLTSYQTSTYFAIMLNGEVIWPSNGTPYLYTSDNKNSPFSDTANDNTALAKMRAYEAFPSTLYVSQGDNITFVAIRGHALSNMVTMKPKVTYTAVYEKASASASVSLQDRFSVKLDIWQKDARASEWGIEIRSGVTEGIVAKNMQAEITYVPYQIINGVRMEGDVKTTSLAAILALYVADESGTVTAEQKALATALLHYGAAADAYFHDTTLSADIQAALSGITVDTSEAAQQVGATLESGVTRTYEMTAVNLLLNDTLEMKVYFKALSGEAITDLSRYTLRVTNEYGVTKALVKGSSFTYRNGTDQKEVGVSFSIPAVEYGQKQYMTLLMDDTVVSETRIYGVMTYAARQYGKENGVMNDILRAITDVAEKAAAMREQVVAATDTTTYKYCGTWEPSGTAMISHWNTSYVEVDFYGTSVTPVFSKRSTFCYAVDSTNCSTQVTAEGAYTITVAEDGKHTLRIKTTGRTNNVYFAGVKTASQYLLARTAEKTHYIHFVGDSISDAGASFPYWTGDNLGWDYAVTAISGMALETGYGYWKNNNPQMYASIGVNVGMEDAFFKYGHPTDSMTGAMKERYEGYYTDASLTNNYSAGYTPDIVFIFLGTNDQLAAETDATRFAAAYSSFVADILKVYGEDTDIWVMQALNTKNDAARRSCITKAVEVLQDTYGEQVQFLSGDTLDSWNVSISTDGIHPNAAGYSTLTNEIIALLREYYK